VDRTYVVLCDFSDVIDINGGIDSRELLFVPTPRLHGYDFSYQGLLGIWLGFRPSPQHQASHTSTPRIAAVDLPPSTPGTRATGLEGHSSHPKRRALSPSDDIHGDFHAAIVTLSSRKGVGASWQPTISTHKLEQRQFALQLCGWSLKEEDLYNAIKRSIFPSPLLHAL
jgi:hypothetical protein